MGKGFQVRQGVKIVLKYFIIIIILYRRTDTQQSKVTFVLKFTRLNGNKTDKVGGLCGNERKKYFKM